MHSSVEAQGDQAPGDLVDTDEAARITGLSADEIAQELTPAHVEHDGRSWWERSVCEATGLERHRVGDPAGYWLTLAQAAELLGVTRQAAYTLPLPVRQAARGHRVVRRIDVEQAARVRAFHAMVRRKHHTVD